METPGDGVGGGYIAVVLEGDAMGVPFCNKVVCVPAIF